MRSLFGFVKFILILIIIGFFLKNVLPEVIKGYANLKTVKGWTDMVDSLNKPEKELLKTDAPVFEFDDLSDILELATVKQKRSVKLDTLLTVLKKYNIFLFDMVGIHKIFTKESQARTINEFSFELKAGFDLKNSHFNIKPYNFGDTLFITLPQPELLSCESLTSEFKNLVSDAQREHDVFYNEKEITISQYMQLEMEAKKLCINKNKEDILAQAEKSGIYQIQKMLKNNKFKFIKIEIY